MSGLLKTDKNYSEWLKGLKGRIRSVQIKAAVKVNAELLNFYWELGADIVCKQKETNWGNGLIERLSKDLSAEFPEMKGFSLSNLRYARQWYLFYNQHDTIHQQVVGELTRIPWGHNIAIISKCKNEIGRASCRERV